MTGELDPVTLLYRADWTRLSLTADVRGMLDYRLLARQNGAQGRILQSIPPGTTGVRHFRARLLVAPGGRYHAQADGDDDEFRPVLAPYRAAPAHAPDPDAHAPDPDEGVRTRLTTRYAEMLRPVNLLSGFALAFRGPTTFAGRDALHVVATPSAQAAAISPGLKPLDRIEVFVDAETGILLRREEIFEGQTLRFTELTSARFGPLEAGDAGHFPHRTKPHRTKPHRTKPHRTKPHRTSRRKTRARNRSRTSAGPAGRRPRRLRMPRAAWSGRRSGSRPADPAHPARAMPTIPRRRSRRTTPFRPHGVPKTRLPGRSATGCCMP